MIRTVRGSLVVALAVLAGGLGCQAKLTVSKTFKLPDEAEVVKIFEMPAQPGEQTIKIDVTVKSGSSVDVFVVPANLVGAAIASDKKEKKVWEEKAYGSKRDVTAGSMTAKVPAKAEYKVLVIQSDNAKQTSEVEIKITN